MDEIFVLVKSLGFERVDDWGISRFATASGQIVGLRQLGACLVVRQAVVIVVH